MKSTTERRTASRPRWQMPVALSLIAIGSGSTIVARIVMAEASGNDDEAAWRIRNALTAASIGLPILLLFLLGLSLILLPAYLRRRQLRRDHPHATIVTVVHQRSTGGSALPDYLTRERGSIAVTFGTDGVGFWVGITRPRKIGELSRTGLRDVTAHRESPTVGRIEVSSDSGSLDFRALANGLFRWAPLNPAEAEQVARDARSSLELTP